MQTRIETRDSVSSLKALAMKMLFFHANWLIAREPISPIFCRQLRLLKNFSVGLLLYLSKYFLIFSCRFVGNRFTLIYAKYILEKKNNSRFSKKKYVLGTGSRLTFSIMEKRFCHKSPCHN